MQTIQTPKTLFSDIVKVQDIVKKCTNDDSDWFYKVESFGKYFAVGIYDDVGLIGYM